MIEMWNQKFTSTMTVWLRANRFFEDWKKVNGVVISRATNVATWGRPDIGYVKVNVDASIPIEGGRPRFGIIARNSVGAVLVVKIGQFIGALNPKEAKAMAIKEALSWIDNVG